jgi:hypothetical protein
MHQGRGSQDLKYAKESHRAFFLLCMAVEYKVVRKVVKLLYKDFEVLRLYEGPSSVRALAEERPAPCRHVTRDRGKRPAIGGANRWNRGLRQGGSSSYHSRNRHEGVQGGAELLIRGPTDSNRWCLILCE